MTADVQTECDKGDGVGECKPSRIADIEAERTLLSPFVVLLRVGSLLVHAMDVNAPDAWQTSRDSGRLSKNRDCTQDPEAASRTTLVRALVVPVGDFVSRQCHSARTFVGVHGQVAKAHSRIFV
jgi:hypothetical protein